MSNIESEVDEIANFYHKDEFKAVNKDAYVELDKVLTEYWLLFKKSEQIRISDEDIENWDDNKYHS